MQDEARATLDAYYDGLTGMLAVIKNIGETAKKPSPLLVAGEYETRVLEITESRRAIKVMRHMVTRGTTVVDLDKLVSGGEALYLLLSRRHFQLLDRVSDPKRFRHETPLGTNDGENIL